MFSSEIVDILENCDIFGGLNREEIKKISKLGRIEEYDSGEQLFNQGDFGDELYIIAEGHVLLERAIDLATKKGSAVITILGKGRALGCWSTLLGEPHTLLSSAICRKPTKVFVLKGTSLRKMMTGDSRLGFKVLERLCFILRERIQGAYGAMENL